MIPTYNPFQKELNNLDEAELTRLVADSIAEGWYIEYKAEIPRKSGKIEGMKIAKSISAFANTKGGWLIFGIQANDKNIATSVCGVDLSEYNNIADQLSQVIASNISPKPVYHFKIISLASEKSVIVIQVENCPTPPYVTSQGVIYQRENNESNPIKDRYIIEKLTEKTEQYQQSIERFCNMDFTQPKGQSESMQSYLELYIFPTPFNNFHFQNFFSSDFFNKTAAIFYQLVQCVFEKNDGKKLVFPLGLGFNSIYSSENSLIIRPLSDNNLIYRTTTVEIFSNGNMKFLVPLNDFSLSNVPEFYKDSEIIDYLNNKYSPLETVQQPAYSPGYSTRLETVTRRKQTDFVNYIKMIDGIDFIFKIMIAGTQYRELLLSSGYDLTADFGFRAKLTATWRKFLFFDNPNYFEKLKLYNLPIAPKYDVEVPIFTNGNYYYTNLQSHSSIFSIALMLLNAIGLPDSANMRFDEIVEGAAKRYKTFEE